MRSPGMMTGMPGGYGVICSAQIRQAAWPAGTVSFGTKNASRGSRRCRRRCRTGWG